MSSDISSSPKLLHYSNFKTCFSTELYIDTVNIRKYKSALSKFRCSNHRLAIEVGRHLNISKSDRICVYCCKQGMSYIEDEFHFIVICPLYSNLRIKYLSEIKLENYRDFLNLFSTTKCNLLKHLSCFIYHGMKLHEAI